MNLRDISALAAHPQARQQITLDHIKAASQGASRTAWIEINRPLSAFALTPAYPVLSTGTAPQTTLSVLPISLPIGMDIKSITALAADIDDGWLATAFNFGTLNLVNPQGSAEGVNLSMFDPRVEHVDRLTPWILSKTVLDVQVSYTVRNSVFKYQTGVAPVTGSFVAAAFHGFSLNAFQEEQVCAIQTRLGPSGRSVGSAGMINVLQTVYGTAGANTVQPPIAAGAVHFGAMGPAQTPQLQYQGAPGNVNRLY